VKVLRKLPVKNSCARFASFTNCKEDVCRRNHAYRIGSLSKNAFNNINVTIDVVEGKSPGFVI
jgi:hypothetical protein